MSLPLYDDGGTWLERAHGGALTAEQLSNGDGHEFVEEIEIVSVRTG